MVLTNHPQYYIWSQYIYIMLGCTQYTHRLMNTSESEDDVDNSKLSEIGGSYETLCEI